MTLKLSGLNNNLLFFSGLRLAGLSWVVLDWSLSWGNRRQLRLEPCEGSAALVLHDGFFTHISAGLVGTARGCQSLLLHVTSLGFPHSMVASGRLDFLDGIWFPQHKHAKRSRWKLQGFLWPSLRNSWNITSTEFYWSKSESEGHPRFKGEETAPWHEYWEVWFMVVGVLGGADSFLRLATKLAIGLWVNYLTSSCLSLLSYKMG